MRTFFDIATAWALGLGPWITVGCADEATTLLRAPCTDDAACDAGSVCRAGDCVPAESLACGAGEVPILQPDPPRLDFGVATGGAVDRTLRLRNIGDCTLVLFHADLVTADAFRCSSCRPDSFPVEVFPLRTHALALSFQPRRFLDGSNGGDVHTGTLLVTSDDRDYPELRVPLRGRFEGTPQAATSPASVDFDYVPVGRTATRTIEVRNRGSGTASLQVRRIEVLTSTPSAFSWSAPINEGPVDLRPIVAGDDERLTVEVAYHPKEREQHHADLLITTNSATPPGEGGEHSVRIPLRGASTTPARISVSPGRIDLGPVAVGDTVGRPITLVNEGGTPLQIRPRWGGARPNTDLFTSRARLPPILPGDYDELMVLVTATAPGPIQGLLVLETNVPATPTLSVGVAAEGRVTVGAQVIKIDMTFDNGDDGAFDDDFRNVDLILENPYGLVVHKADPQPTHWNEFGRPTWLAFGAKEEPERIVLADFSRDGTYRVQLAYVEDCSSVPSGLVAAVLGISVEALISYLTGGNTLGITGGQLSDVVESLCLARSSSAATVTVFVNGDVVTEVPVVLGAKNDAVYAADIIVAGGQVSVVP